MFEEGTEIDERFWITLEEAADSVGMTINQVDKLIKTEGTIRTTVIQRKHAIVKVDWEDYWTRAKGDQRPVIVVNIIQGGIDEGDDEGGGGRGLDGFQPNLPMADIPMPFMRSN